MTQEPPLATKNPLGPYLSSVRHARKYSLRQVEVLTNKAVSNAYLSQIESGKIAQPSPNVLHALATAYDVSYQKLMELAGFMGVIAGESTVPKRRSILDDLNVTGEEEQELVAYLGFRRSQKPR